jgi:hypothetical protein
MQGMEHIQSSLNHVSKDGCRTKNRMASKSVPRCSHVAVTACLTTYRQEHGVNFISSVVFWNLKAVGNGKTNSICLHRICENKFSSNIVDCTELLKSVRLVKCVKMYGGLLWQRCTNALKERSK